MSLTRISGIVLLGALVLMCQGCGSVSTETPAPDKGQSKQSVFDLHAQLAQARDELQREQEHSADLQAQVQSLTQKAADMQSELAKARTSKARTEAPRPSAGAAASKDPARIQLMGEKAIAEFRAAQLSQRLEELSKDLDRKEAELESIHQTAQAKDKEVALLRQQIDKLQAGEQTRTAELNTRLDQINKELAERSAAAQKFKQELDEKTDLLNALKNAVADASQLKSTAETENSRLQTELADAKSQVESLTQLANQWKEEADRRGEETEKAAQDAAQKGQEADQWRAEAERYRSQAETSAKELQEAKARAEELTGRLQAMEGEAEAPEPQEEGRPSAVDNILKGGPKAQESKEPQSSLY